MKKVFFLYLLLSSIAGFAQNTYQPGYFITNDGQKTGCLIKNLAWKNNPTEFDYKMSELDEPSTKTIQEVTEFSVDNAYKFRRYTVQIDRSSSIVGRMSDQKEPKWETATLFLKVLVEGKATLYQYEENNLVKYFYSSGDHLTAGQLLYKEYMISNIVAENNTFRNQLYTLMSGGTGNTEEYRALRYQKKPLVKLFLKYNGDSGEKTTNLSDRQNKGDFNLKVSAGVSFSSYTLENALNEDFFFEFDNKTSIRLGAEFEFIMPFNNNKWALFVEPNYQSYKAEGSSDVLDWRIEYRYLELPLGVRHYMFLDDNSKLFLNAAYVMSFPIGDAFVQYNDAIPLDISKNSNFAIGGGYSIDRFSIEARYNFTHSIMKEYTTYSSDYSSMSLILAYRIL